MSNKADASSLIYWLEIDQSLIIGNGQVKITLVNTAKGKARLRLQADRNLQPIETKQSLPELNH
jgi:hypothetical protein